MDVIPTTDALDQPTVMTQIRKLVEITDENISEFADTINEGTYKSVSMTGPVNGKYTFNFVNQNDETESFEFLVKDIKNIASSQNGSTVTLTVTYSNNTTQTFTWTAGGDVTTNTAQTINAVKTFTASPIVPDTPSGTHAAINMAYAESTVDGVNNIFHKSANEKAIGSKELLTSSFINNKVNNIVNSTSNIRGWIKCCKIKSKSDSSIFLKFFSVGITPDRSVDVEISFSTNNSTGQAGLDKMISGVQSFVNIENIAILRDDTESCFYIYLNTSAITTYYGIVGIVKSWMGRNGEIRTINEGDIVWYSNTIEDPTTLTDLISVTIVKRFLYEL